MLYLIHSPLLFAYAKPVPFNFQNLRDRTWGPVKIALAGPLSNILLAVMAGLFLRFLPGAFHAGIMPSFLTLVVVVNLSLAIFNLIPIPPLDGHWVLMALLPERFVQVRYFIMRYGVFFFLVFLIMFSQVLAPLINVLFRVIVGA